MFRPLPLSLLAELVELRLMRRELRPRRELAT
jgi:hypothetical protein